MEQAKVALERAKQAAARLRPLLARHEVSEQQVFEAELAVTTARLQQESAEATLRTMLIGPRPEAVAEAESKITWPKGRWPSRRPISISTHPRAHRRGRSTASPAIPGRRSRSGRPSVRWSIPARSSSSIYLPSRSAEAIRVGQKARVKGVESRRELGRFRVADETQASEGKVEFVGRIADAQTGNLPSTSWSITPTGG